MKYWHFIQPVYLNTADNNAHRPLVPSRRLITGAR
nr:MAG TPA: hypothetical protein [Caudoviricetes sp.]